MNLNRWLSKNTKSLEGKYIAISGSTGGIGKSLCRYLAQLGAVLVLLNRNDIKAQRQEEGLKSECPSAKIFRISIDMENLDSVKTAVEELKKLPLYAVIHNAGAYNIPRRKCSTGFDNVFQINFVSPYYITKELLPTLRKSGGRVIAVGSIAHNYSQTDKKDIDFSTRKAASKAYGNAKRFLMFSLYGLFENEEDAFLSVTHPGITFTNITAHYPKLIFALIKHPMKVIFMSPKTACLSILKGLFETTEDSTWIGPGVFNVWGRPKKQTLKTCDRSEKEFIFSTAEKIYTHLL